MLFLLFQVLVPSYCQDILPRWISFRAAGNCMGKKLGPIWYGASRKFIFGCTSGNNTDFFFGALYTTKNISLDKGWFSLQKLKCFSPVHERQMLKQLCSQETTRTAARNHLAQHLPGMEPQFGMHLDSQRLVIIVE